MTTNPDLESLARQICEAEGHDPDEGQRDRAGAEPGRLQRELSAQRHVAGTCVTVTLVDGLVRFDEARGWRGAQTKIELTGSRG